MNIVITGPMGSGKSVVGKVVSRNLHMNFVDTDFLIEKKLKMSINDIFHIHGEDYFRKIEEEVIKDIFKFDNYVIATGGGVVLNPLNMRRLRRNGIIINLRSSVKTLYGRVKNRKNRPLLNQESLESDLRRYSEGRREFYNNADFIINTDLLKVKQIAGKIINITKLPIVKICGCVAGENPEKQIKDAIGLGASLIELRLDLIPNPDIKSLIKICGVPVIATDKKNPKNLIKSIDEGCDFVDVDVNSYERREIVDKAKSNGCKIIVSFHDFKKTTNKLNIDYRDADIIKIATMINSKDDVNILLSFLDYDKDVIIIGMGENAQFLRVIAPLLGSYLTYASISEKTAPGQLHISKLNEIYKKMGLR